MPYTKPSKNTTSSPTGKKNLIPVLPLPGAGFVEGEKLHRDRKDCTGDDAGVFAGKYGEDSNVIYNRSISSALRPVFVAISVTEIPIFL